MCRVEIELFINLPACSALACFANLLGIGTKVHAAGFVLTMYCIIFWP